MLHCQKLGHAPVDVNNIYIILKRNNMTKFDEQNFKPLLSGSHAPSIKTSNPNSLMAITSLMKQGRQSTSTPSERTPYRVARATQAFITKPYIYNLGIGLHHKPFQPCLIASHHHINHPINSYKTQINPYHGGRDTHNCRWKYCLLKLEYDLLQNKSWLQTLFWIQLRTNLIDGIAAKHLTQLAELQT